ncbi:MAG: hypothetical protein KKA64_03805 [Nanoarchaeota archaeon]|nr:hypothetical protein [Nanoarchaeota archaeon]
MVKQLVHAFTFVQAIPYKCRAELIDGNGVSTNIPYANCRQKRDLLKRSFESLGYKTKELDAIFDWTDLPLPGYILKILKKSGTKQKHHLLEVKVNDKCIKIDPTWNLELRDKGFPITVSWNGETDTKQVSFGRIIYYDPKIQRVTLLYFPEERENFTREFNKWIGWKY